MSSATDSNPNSDYESGGDESTSLASAPFGGDEVGLAVAQQLLASCYDNPAPGKSPHETARAIIKAAMKITVGTQEGNRDNGLQVPSYPQLDNLTSVLSFHLAAQHCLIVSLLDVWPQGPAA